jgi:hypothetical protein
VKSRRGRAHRHLRYEGNAQQILCEGAGVISPLGVDTSRGSDTRRRLRCEDNARHVPRGSAGVVDSLWCDNRQGVDSCVAMVVPSPPPPARRVAGTTRVPRGVPGPTSEIVAACPCPDGLARDGTQEAGQALYYPAPGVPLVVGVTSTSREGERGSLFVRSFPPREPPSRMALDLPFIDARRGSRHTMGGVAMH